MVPLTVWILRKIVARSSGDVGSSLELDDPLIELIEVFETLDQEFTDNVVEIVHSGLLRARPLGEPPISAVSAPEISRGADDVCSSQKTSRELGTSE